MVLYRDNGGKEGVAAEDCGMSGVVVADEDEHLAVDNARAGRGGAE